MARNNSYSVKFRRRREGLTNYKKRLNLLKSKKPRIVLRKSNKYFNISFVEYDSNGDKVINSMNSKFLKKQGIKSGFNNMASAYLTGYFFVKNFKITKPVVLDLGMKKPGRKFLSAVKGMVEAGVNVEVNENKLPKMELINSRYDVSKIIPIKNKINEPQVKKIKKETKAEVSKSSKTVINEGKVKKENMNKEVNNKKEKESKKENMNKEVNNNKKEEESKK